MKPNTYEILRRAVEEGIAYGYRRAHKHTDAPSDDALFEALEQAIMGSISEMFTFGDESEPQPS